MNHALITSSLVGVWSPPLPGVPRFQPQKLQHLFGDPYTTQVGVSPDGSLMVQKMGKPPTQTVLFGSSKFQIVCPTADETSRVFSQVITEAHDLANQQIPYFAQIGLNTEHEWSKPAYNPSHRWLATRYILKGLTPEEGEVPEVKAISLNFELRTTNPDRMYNVTLQPRGGREDGVYAAINDHRDWGRAMPSTTELLTLLRESVEQIKTRVVPLILGGVADA